MSFSEWVHQNSWGWWQFDLGLSPVQQTHTSQPFPLEKNQRLRLCNHVVTTATNACAESAQEWPINSLVWMEEGPRPFISELFAIDIFRAREEAIAFGCVPTGEPNQFTIESGKGTGRDEHVIGRWSR